MSAEQHYNNALDIIEESCNCNISQSELASLSDRFIKEVDNLVATMQTRDLGTKFSIFIPPSCCSIVEHVHYAVESLSHLFNLTHMENCNTHEVRFTQAKAIAYMKNIIDLQEMTRENIYFEGVSSSLVNM